MTGGSRRSARSGTPAARGDLVLPAGGDHARRQDHLRPDQPPGNTHLGRDRPPRHVDRGRPDADDIGITRNGKTVYVLSMRARTATPINVRTGRPNRPIPVGIRPRNIVFTPDSRTAYVVNQGSGTVTPINIATNKAGKPRFSGTRSVTNGAFP